MPHPHWTQEPLERGPETRLDFYDAILKEVRGRLTERQLDGLTEHRYGHHHLGDLPLDQLQDLLRYLRKWTLEQRVKDQAAAEAKVFNKSRGAG